MAEIWVLTFYLTGSVPLKAVIEHAGEYVSEERCMQGARMQLPHWQQVYGRKIFWRCHQNKGAAL